MVQICLCHLQVHSPHLLQEQEQLQGLVQALPRQHVVNGIAFFTTLGRDIRFGTAEHVPSRIAKQLAKSLIKIVRLYALGGFVVRNVLMDGIFAKIKPEVELDINILAAKEHVGEIERYHFWFRDWESLGVSIRRALPAG